MTIRRTYSKGATIYQLFADDDSWIANYNSLVSAAAVLRYVSGCVMNNREKVIALAALENTTGEADSSETA